MLSRYTNSDDVVFGEIHAGRHVPVQDITEILGPTITSVPFGVKLNAEQRVEDYLLSIQKQSADALQFTHAGLQRIRGMSKSHEEACDFQNLLILQPSKNDNEHLPLDMERVGIVSEGFMTYAMVLHCSFDNESVQFCVEFDPKVMSKEKVQQIVQQLRHVLQQLTRRLDDILVRNVNLLCPEDQHFISSWNQQVPKSVDACIYDLISQQAQLRPDSPALCWSGGDMSYRELDDQSVRCNNASRSWHRAKCAPHPIFYHTNIYAHVLQYNAFCYPSIAFFEVSRLGNHEYLFFGVCRPPTMSYWLHGISRPAVGFRRPQPKAAYKRGLSDKTCLSICDKLLL